MNAITIKAPAKVNTFLKVVGKRPDGYHDLQMVMVPLSLADELHVELKPAGIEFEMDGGGDPGMTGEKNLVFKAAIAFKDNLGVDKGARIILKKRTPIAAGLGGGSSDAAAVLKALNILWKIDLEPKQLAGLGSKIGADVPFFCYGAPAFVEGTGNLVHIYSKFPRLPLLLINPGFAVSTPWIYKKWDLELTMEESDVKRRQPVRQAGWLFQAVDEVVAALYNDLESVAIPAFPEIATIKNWLLNMGADGVLMSGSGPTVFGVFKDVIRRGQAFRAQKPGNWRVFEVESVENF